MKILPTKFEKYKSTFEQIKREGMVALYTQTANSGGSPRFVACEVIENPERVIAGVTIYPTESLPGLNDWGQKAWTFLKLEDAEAKFESHKQRVLERERERESKV